MRFSLRSVTKAWGLTWRQHCGKRIGAGQHAGAGSLGSRRLDHQVDREGWDENPGPRALGCRNEGFGNSCRKCLSITFTGG